jgi:hypothetical protein
MERRGRAVPVQVTLCSGILEALGSELRQNICHPESCHLLETNISEEGIISIFRVENHLSKKRTRNQRASRLPLMFPDDAN